MRSRHALILLLLCFVTLAASCGKKANPRWTDPLRPPSVEDLSLHQRPGEVLLRWDYPEAAEAANMSFEVERSADGSKPETITKTKETTYLDSDLEEEKIYTYSIVARSDVSKSRRVSVSMVEGEPPPPPQGLVIRASADTLELTWEHPDRGGLFNVYRSVVPGTEFYTPLGPPVRGTTTAIRLVLDSPVYFTVRALAPNTPHGVVYESAPSDEVMLDPATLIPEAPTGLRALPVNGGVLLIWTESPEPWVRSYRIYRAGPDGVFAQIAKSGTPAHTDAEPPKDGGPYTYRVTAVGPGGEGPPSQSIAEPAPEPAEGPEK